MKYGIFTAHELAFRNQCQEIFDNHPLYAGYRTLPMEIWTKTRIRLVDGTDIHWINTRKDIEIQLCGLRFNRIYVLDGVSKLQMLEHVFPRFCTPENFT
jgi:hypothetical protein